MQQPHQQPQTQLQQQAAPNPQQQQQIQQQPLAPLHQQQQQGSNSSHVGFLHNGKPGDRVHFCVTCQLPIAVYGRLMPCMHAFCLACAAEMPKCFICQAHINRMERINQPLFISAATLQSFTSEVAMAQHTKKLYDHLQNDPAFAAGLRRVHQQHMQQQQMQQQQQQMQQQQQRAQGR